MKALENSIVRLAINLSLFAVALSLMCIGKQWLFFIGLGLMLVSGCFSVRSRLHMNWPRWLGLGLLGATGVAIFLWLSSCGRKPLSPVTACAAGLGVVISELEYWRASRNASDNA